MPSSVLVAIGLELTGWALVAGQMAVIYAISTVASRIFAPNIPQVQDNGVRQQVPPDTSTGIPVVYGDAYLGGKFCDAVLSIDQTTMYYVMAISNISPNGQFSFDTSKFYYADRLITFDGTDLTKVVSLTDGAGNVDTKISGNLNIYLYRSNASGTITKINTSSAPSVVMGGSDINVSQRWASSGRQMNGLAFAIIKLKYNRDAGTTQLQPITFYAKQYLNGTGVAKPGDVWYDYITNTVYGGAVNSSFVDSASATALNSYSDQLITFDDYNGNPQTQARYRINGVIDTGKTALSNIDQIVTCCDSWMQYNASTGKWAIVINKAESASLAFNDTNIIGSINVGAVDITQSVNQIEAKFNDKTNRDQANYVNEKTPTGLLYPNEPVNKYTISFDLVNDSVQALYLANRILEQAREDLTITINTTYYGIQANAGDVVSITNSAYGWSSKLFRVMKVQEASLPDGTLGATLNLIEYNAQVYDNQDITQYVPAGNTNNPSPNYFSALTAPTVAASRPSDAVPSFDIQTTVPTTGRVTVINLYYTTTPLPSTSDWKYLDSASNVNSEPFVNGATYLFANLSLPTGTYYFGYTVGNEIGNSGLSSLSSSFAWSPAGATGPTGPRSSSGYLYYALSSASAPSAPSASGYNFTTGTFSSLTSNWSTTFTAPDPITNPSTEDGSKFWACRYNVSEATYGGTQTVTLTAVFNWTNLDGLVTFTNVKAPSGTTFIDGGNLITNTLSVNTIKSNTTGTYNGTSFGLGTTTSYYGVQAGAQFITNSSSYVGTMFVDTTNSGTGTGGTAVLALNQNYTNGKGNATILGLGGFNSSTSLYGSQAAMAANDYAGLWTSYNTSGTIIAQLATGYNNGTTGYAYYIFSGSVGPFTAGHDGLQLLTESTPEVGDIMVDTGTYAVSNVSNTISTMAISSSANQQGGIGIYVSSQNDSFVPAALGYYIPNPNGFGQIFVLKPEYANVYDTYRAININALGEGMVNVCGQNGNLSIGDLIVCSDMAGKGMKQADDIVRSYTIAKCRENIIFDSPDQVKMVSCIYMAG